MEIISMDNKQSTEELLHSIQDKLTDLLSEALQISKQIKGISREEYYKAKIAFLEDNLQEERHRKLIWSDWKRDETIERLVAENRYLKHELEKATQPRVDVESPYTKIVW